MGTQSPFHSSNLSFVFQIECGQSFLPIYTKLALDQIECGQSRRGAVAGVVGIEGGVVSEVINLESSGVGAPDRRPRHDQPYYEARFRTAR